MREWQCAACERNALTNDETRPEGWTDGPIVTTQEGKTITLDLCPVCSIDRAAAIQRWVKSIDIRPPS